jgi:tryptophanyl-tRNA synthetase
MMFTPYSLVKNNPTVKHELKSLDSKWKTDPISMWFINYPLSQSADIMLFWWDIVPVWEDQLPHIELTRNIIKKVNSITWLNYNLPKALLSDVPRLVWIDWNEKMSKSLWNVISLTASKKEIKNMVNKMYTDSGKTSIQSKWDITNHVVFKYLDIFYNGKEHLDDLKKKYINWWEFSIWDWVIKNILIDVLDEIIWPIRERRKEYEWNSDLITRIIEEWSDNARAIWVNNIHALKESLGLIY